jgi:hypothetical protein
VQTLFARTLIFFILPMLLPANSPQVSVIDSGSTNRAGATITIDEVGNATVEQRGSEPQSTKLAAELCQRFIRDVKAAGPLSALPPQHCPKSVSFGSSLYVAFNGDRSPDISCSPQKDPRSAALQKDANEILATVRKQLGISRFGPVRPVRPLQ